MCRETSTKDIEEAAFLMCQEGVEFHRADTKPKANGVAVFFVFQGVEEVSFDKLRREFFNRHALVEPKAYVQALTDIRNVLHDALRNAKKGEG